MNDKEIVDLFWQRRESAIAEVDKKYGRYCRYIARNILGDDADAEEIVSDTYLKLWGAIPPNRPDPLKPYIGTITRRLALNLYEAKNAKKRGGQVALCLDELDECIPDEGMGSIGDGLALRDALNRFVGSLPERTARLFVRRYWYSASIAEIAEEYGMSVGAVSTLLLRTRRKLKEFLEREKFVI